MGAKERERRKDYQNAVEFLCADLTALEEKVAKVADPQWRPAFETVTSAEPFTDPWYAAVRRLHELAENADVPGGLGLTTPMGQYGWPGSGGAAPARVSGWVCPKDVCTRVELRDDESEESKPDTECHLFGGDMRLVEG